MRAPSKALSHYIILRQDDEEGDMYEAPPCERPAAKVPPRPVEEDVYLGNSTARSFHTHYENNN